MLAALSPHAQNPRQHGDRIVIMGGVQTPAGEPLVGVSVVLERVDHSFIQARSDSEGKFILLADSAGTYMVRAEKPGWRTAVTPSLTFSPGEEKHLNFVLQKMDAGGYRHVPVLEDGKPVSIISARDMLRFVTRLCKDA